MVGSRPAGPSPTPPTTGARPPSRRRWRRLALVVAALVVAALAVYPAFVLGTTYTITQRSDLAGGRHGPRDAYRHSLASAIVAWTTSSRCVEWVTAVMERDDSDAGHCMDAHDNRVGIRLAARAADWASLLRDVRAAVDAGNVMDAVRLADPDRIVWLPPDRWLDRPW